MIICVIINVNIFVKQENINETENLNMATQTKTEVLQKPTCYFYGIIYEPFAYRKQYNRYTENHVGWILDSRTHIKPHTTSFG